MTGIRLQLALAKAGLASRRHAEEMITAGRVLVNGSVVTELGTRIDPVRDRVTVDGKIIEPEPPAYLLLFKPKGYVTTAQDPENRATVFELLPADLVRLFSVGRLDYNTEGALLLTNDGELAHALMHPSRGVPKTYHAKFRGLVSPEQVRRLRSGVELPPARPLAADGSPLPTPKLLSSEPEHSAPAHVTVLESTGRHSWLEITLHEGKNRQIHRMAEAVGSSLLKLMRVAYATLTLDGLQVGEYRELDPREVMSLRQSVGLLPRTDAPVPRADRSRGEPSARSRGGSETGPAERAPAWKNAGRSGDEPRGTAGRPDRAPQDRPRMSDQSNFRQNRSFQDRNGPERPFRRGPAGDSSERAPARRPSAGGWGAGADRDRRPSQGSSSFGGGADRAPRRREEGGYQPSGRFGGAREGGFRDGGSRDSGFRAAGPRDGGFRAAGPREGGFREAGPRDGGFRAAGPREGGFREAGPREGGFRTAGPREGGFRDGGSRDSGAFSAGRREGGQRGGWRPAEGAPRSDAPRPREDRFAQGERPARGPRPYNSDGPMGDRGARFRSDAPSDRPPRAPQQDDRGPRRPFRAPDQGPGARGDRGFSGGGDRPPPRRSFGADAGGREDRPVRRFGSEDRAPQRRDRDAGGFGDARPRAPRQDDRAAGRSAPRPAPADDRFPPDWPPR